MRRLLCIFLVIFLFAPVLLSQEVKEYFFPLPEYKDGRAVISEKTRIEIRNLLQSFNGEYTLHWTGTADNETRVWNSRTVTREEGILWWKKIKKERETFPASERVQENSNLRFARDRAVTASALFGGSYEYKLVDRAEDRGLFLKITFQEKKPKPEPEPKSTSRVDLKKLAKDGFDIATAAYDKASQNEKKINKLLETNFLVFGGTAESQKAGGGMLIDFSSGFLTGANISGRDWNNISEGSVDLFFGYELFQNCPIHIFAGYRYTSELNDRWHANGAIVGLQLTQKIAGQLFLTGRVGAKKMFVRQKAQTGPVRLTGEDGTIKISQKLLTPEAKFWQKPELMFNINLGLKLN